MESGGQPGNQNAASGAEWRQALRRAMAHKAEGDYRKTLQTIAAAVVDKALEGDKDAWREIAEREDGKSSQGVTIANAPGQTLKVTSVTYQAVLPDGTTRALSSGVHAAVAASSL